MWRVILPTLSVVLIGCAKPLDIATVTQIKSHTGSQSIDVFEPQRRRGTVGIPDYAGDQFVEVRTYTINTKQGFVELGGAKCDLSAARYSATMTTPARVRVPLYRGSSSVLGIACEKPGYRNRHITLAPVDIDRQERHANTKRDTESGAAIAALIDATADNSMNEWRYPQARIILYPVAKKPQ